MSALAHSSETTDNVWQIDPAASRVTFTIEKRLLFVRRLSVTGQFADAQGAISLNEREPARSHAEVAVGAASITTQQAQRDAHLRSAAFFDVARYPTVRFESRRIDAVDAASGGYRVTGNLTIRDITREVQLEARYLPPGNGTGSSRLTITLAASLNRHDFGLSWGNPFIKIADDLRVTIEVQAVRQS